MSHWSDLERDLLHQSGAVLVDPRLLRRIIKQHRGITGLVPHGRCYGLSRAALDQLVAPGELPVPIKQLPEDVVLLPRPTPREMTRLRQEVATRLWRNVFHARVHIALDKRIKEGHFEPHALRQRIDRIGQTEFDEVRAILRHDDLVMPPGDDREVYVEFAALFLELRYFAPALLVTTFVGIAEPERVRAILAEDLDITALLEHGRPPIVVPPAGTRDMQGTSMPSFSAPVTFGAAPASTRPASSKAYVRLLDKAAAARTAGNDVRAALLCAQAATVLDPELSKRAQAAGREALMHLGERLTAALADPEQRERRQDWSLLLILGARAAEERAVRYAVEARLLYTLQRAAVEFERGQRAVDVWTWIQSLGKRSVVRDLPVTRELRVARLVHDAAARVRNVRISDADRKLLSRLLHWASDRAEGNVRRTIRPHIQAVFDDVGLKSTNGPELLARNKVIEELIDFLISRGYLSYDALRDALSRNQLKLDDLSGPGELWKGDAIVKADAGLAERLDGVYRKSDIYVRGLEKMSSLSFGTKIGRILALYLILPLGLSFVILTATQHLLSSVMHWFGKGDIELVNLPTWDIKPMLGLAAGIFALIHSGPFRAFAWQVLEIIAMVLATIFFRIPRAILTSALVRGLVHRPGVRFTLRRVILPLGLGTAAFFLIPFDEWYYRLPFGIALFTSSSALFGSRLGAFVEDFIVDQLAPTWAVVSRQWLPGLFRLIARFFDALMDLLLRVMVRVDEFLRFREGESKAALYSKATAGFFWAIVAYLIRLYVTLFVEPEMNPLKHFPVITVAHKILLTYPSIAEAVYAAHAPLGSVLGPFMGGVDVFLFPAIFGFLAWELKENYKLYRATRPERMPASPVGPHGETMRGLLIVGLHSGTLPKLYERLRRAAQREDDAHAFSWRAGERPKTSARGVGRFRDSLRDIEQGVRRFVERELCAVLHRSPRWRMGTLRVESVFLSSNRIRISLSCASVAEPTEITFEEQSGLVVAGVARAGFITALPGTPEATVLFENALAGLYQLAEVDLVREQIAAEVGHGVQYDIADEGLMVWPSPDFRTELVYALGRRFKPITKPKIRGVIPGVPPPAIDTRRMAFREQGVSWVAWVAAWSAAESTDARIPSLLQGYGILPVATPAASLEQPPAPARLDPEPPPLPTPTPPPLATIAAVPLMDVTQPLPKDGPVAASAPTAPVVHIVPVHTQPMPNKE